VITTSLTWVSTLSTVILQGGVPVLVDIDPKTMNLDPALLEAAITPRTVGIIRYLTGLPCPMDAVWAVAEKHGLWVIEDAAQAMGAHYKRKKIGSDLRSVMSVYSFHPNKNLTTGEGGGTAFHDERFLGRIQRLRFHGIEKDAWKRQSKEGSVHIDVEPAARPTSPWTCRRPSACTRSRSWTPSTPAAASYSAAISNSSRTSKN
jgi:dTDP-4-amino-4,6-dideoxygalactose transaminase